MLSTARSLTLTSWYPESVVEEWISGERLGKRKNHRQAEISRRLDVCRKSTPLIIKSKELAAEALLRLSRQVLASHPSNVSRALQKKLVELGKSDTTGLFQKLSGENDSSTPPACPEG